jgi:hypothetical protein
MTIGLLFWILMLFWLVFGMWTNWPGIASGQYGPFGNSLLLFILLLLLGWHSFGPPVR